MSTSEVSTHAIEEGRARLRDLAAKMAQHFGVETTQAMFLTLTTSLLALDKDSVALAAFLRDLADEVESCEQQIEPFQLN